MAIRFGLPPLAEIPARFRARKSRKVFRKGMFPFAALAIALFFVLAFGIPSTYDLVFDNPMVVTTNPMVASDTPTSNSRKLRGSHHVASNKELISNILFTGLSSAIVLAVVLYWKNEAIEVDQSGLRARDALNRVRFEADWAEIERVEVEQHNRSAEFVVRKGDAELTFSSDELNGYRKLLEEIEGHAPQIDRAPIQAYLS